MTEGKTSRSVARARRHLHSISEVTCTAKESRKALAAERKQEKEGFPKSGNRCERRGGVWSSTHLATSSLHGNGGNLGGEPGWEERVGRRAWKAWRAC